MQVYSYAINDHQDRPDLGAGLVRAGTPQEALEAIGDPRANVYALPDGYPWPDHVRGNVWPDTGA